MNIKRKYWIIVACQEFGIGWGKNRRRCRLGGSGSTDSAEGAVNISVAEGLENGGVSQCLH